MSVGCVLNNGFCLFLGIETAMRFAVELACIVANHRFGTHRRNLGQLGIFLYFDAPTLVVGKVHVKAVDVVQGQDVDKRLHFFEGEEVASHVEHRTTIAKAWLVGDGYAGKANPLRSRLRYGFAQSLYAVECSCGRCAVDGNALFGYF